MRLKEEISSINIYTNCIEDTIIRQRVQQVLEWNIKKSTYHKWLFYILNIVIIILNAFIPILNQIGYYDLLITIFASTTAVITSIITLINFKDVWYRYRSSAEAIKSECIKLRGQVGDYSLDDRERTFIINVESIVSNERNLWQQSRFNDETNS